MPHSSAIHRAVLLLSILCASEFALSGPSNRSLLDFFFVCVFTLAADMFKWQWTVWMKPSVDCHVRCIHKASVALTVASTQLKGSSLPGLQVTLRYSEGPVFESRLRHLRAINKAEICYVGNRLIAVRRHWRWRRHVPPKRRHIPEDGILHNLRSVVSKMSPSRDLERTDFGHSTSSRCLLDRLFVWFGGWAFLDTLEERTPTRSIFMKLTETLILIIQTCRRVTVTSARPNTCRRVIASPAPLSYSPFISPPPQLYGLRPLALSVSELTAGSSSCL
jgi:hypothetical protein